MTTTSAALTVTEAIQTRRSIRKYVQEPMNQADLREILRLAALAPTANNVQPTRFAVVQNKALQQHLQEAAYGQTQVTSAPTVIIVYSDMEDFLANVEETIHPGFGTDQIKSRAATLREDFEKQDVAHRGQWGLAQANITLGFLMLAARGLGYDTNPMLGFDQERLKELLGLPHHTQIAAMLPLGHRAEEGFPHHRHLVERITRFWSD